MEKQVIIIETYREDYGLEQIKRTMTVSELIECLQQYDEDAKVFLSFDNGSAEHGYKEALHDIKSFIDSHPEEPVSKDLEEKVIPTKLKNVFNDKNGSMSFDVDTPRFIKEVCENSGSRMYDASWNIFKGLLAKVAERATEIHDPVLDVLMIRLNLYEIPNEERYKIIHELKEKYDNSLM